MAKTINSGANVVTTQTFTAWLDVTNEMVGAFANVISVDAETFPTGTAGVNGAFVANTLTVTTGLLTANASANVSGNLSVSDTISIGANVVANTSTIVVGNTSIFSSIDNSGFVVGNSNVKADRLYVGNSTVNTVITQSSIDTDGTLAVLGATALANTLASGNTTITGFANVTSTLQVGSAVIAGIANTLSVGNTSVSGSLDVSSALAVGANVVATTSSLSVGNSTVNSSITATAISTTGDLTVSGTINRNPEITLGGVLTGNVTLTNLASGTLTAAYVADSVELGTHTTGNYVATVTTANGISGAVATEGGTAALKVVPGNGITANSSGVHVVVSSGLSVNTSSVSVSAGAGIASNSTGVHVRAGTDIVSNTTGVHVGAGVARLASPTFTGTVTTANLTISGMITANSAAGIDGQVLRSDGTQVYWGQPLEAGDTGFIVDVNAGDGAIKSGTASEPTIGVKANNGITANSSGLFVKTGTGLFTNTTGLFVNASSVSVGTLPVARGGTGTTTFTSGALLKGNGTSAIQVASAADIVGQIGATQVANAAFSNTSGSATLAATANVATNTAITNDISSAVTVYPTWVDGTSGNRANKVSSTKLTFNPSTGVLTATGLSGNGSAVTSVTAAATTGTLTRGTYLTGSNFNGSANQTWAVDATAASTASKVVARDANSSFSANVVNVNVLNTSSDIKLKSNLVIIDEPIERVKALNGYTYDRIGSLNREAGLVAQEVQAVLPEVVSLENGYLGVAYGNIVALLVEAIKDQQKQIDELKSKLGV